MDHSELCSVKVSRSLPSVCRRLQRTLLAQLAMRLSAAEPRLCEHWTCASLNSANTSSTWLIAIRRQAFLQLLSGTRSIYITSVYKSHSHPCVPLLRRESVLWNNKSWQHLPISQCASSRHRSATPCNVAFWLDCWVLSMTFHSAAWLVPMVKIHKLSPSCKGMTKKTWTTVNYVQSRYQEVCHLSADVSNGHCWDSWQCAQVPQSLDFVNLECTEVSTLLWHLPLDSLRFASKLFLQLLSQVKSIHVASAYKSHSHPCVPLLGQESRFWNNKNGQHLPIWDRAAWHHSLHHPAGAKRCWFNLLIELMSARHDRPQCSMTNPQSENPGAVSILQRGDESNHLANGLGSDGSELRSVTLITLSHITKSTDHLQTSRTDIAGTVGNVRKCRKTSILWTWNVQKSQLCFPLGSVRFPSKIFRSCCLEWDQSTTSAYKRHSHPFVFSRYFVRSLAFLASIPLQHPAEATQPNVWQKCVDQTCWLESWPPLWLSSHSRHALALWHVLRIKLLASLHLCSIAWNTITVQPNDWLEWASVLPQTYGLSLLCVLNCSLRQESQEQCARLTDLGTAIREAQSKTYHIAAWVIPITGKINKELSRSYMRMIEKSRTSWQRKCVSHWQSGLAFWLLRLISSCYQKHLQGLELA